MRKRLFLAMAKALLIGRIFRHKRRQYLIQLNPKKLVEKALITRRQNVLEKLWWYKKRWRSNV